MTEQGQVLWTFSGADDALEECIEPTGMDYCHDQSDLILRERTTPVPVHAPKVKPVFTAR